MILCPHYHQLHHSTNPKHYDKNFGLMLSIWDRMFGTLFVPEQDESFSFGLGREGDEYQSTAGLFILPLRKMGRQLGIGRVKGRSDDALPAAQLGIEPRRQDFAG